MQIIPFLKKRALGVMMSGFLLALIGVITLMQTRPMGGYVPNIAIGVAIFGLALYILGRIFLAIQRNESKK
ncbi:hypothetical protein CHISP_1304 [Chitinispirillum alkaliphilum]|nr:hypothetical protein CHISP_1304 [Chitinispirillum alkaliphilum]